MAEVKNPKLEDILEISLQVTQEEREKSPELIEGYDSKDKIWELIIKYSGLINQIRDKYKNIEIKELSHQYAIVRIPEAYINSFARETQIEYVEKPKRLFYELENEKRASCMTPLIRDPNINLHGEGILVAVIDTGIKAEDRAFRDTSGKSRIHHIWDQDNNTFIDREQIDEALHSGAISKIPGRDFNGHGTNVAKIACGNEGVADKADILIIKLGMKGISFPRTTWLMEAVDYAVNKGIEYNMPVAINISFGTNYGDHAGNTLLEGYLNDMSRTWKNSICVGAGNEGLGATHNGGVIKSYDVKDIEFGISEYQSNLNMQVWVNGWDEIDVELISPDGRRLGKVQGTNALHRVTVQDTEIIMYKGEPSPYSTRREFYIEFIPKSSYLLSGIWKLRLSSEKVKTGRFDIWLPGQISLNYGSAFYNPDGELSITIPATADRVITVGAYQSDRDSAASFSGRGYIRQSGVDTQVKPDITAPGVNVSVSSYEKVTGTSYATPFVTGAAALLMEWGIVRGNDPYMYGEKVKVGLIKGARQLPGMATQNVVTGWGALCVKESILKF